MTTRLPIGLTTLAAGSLAATAVAALWLLTARGSAPLGLVVITLDTTRADRLSPYGFMNISMPHLERLAREGVVFDRASSVAPLTLPAHTSLFTGLLPPRHGVRDNADAPLAETQTTLAEVLAARGFRTGAFVGSVVLAPERGLRQGFEEYGGVLERDSPGVESSQRRADEVVDDAIPWVDTVAGSPFFLWTHFYDAHRPYDPPQPYRSIHAHNPYVGEIAFADAQIGRLIDALERLDLLERTVVVVTADHGESLGAHGERDHGIFVYEDVLHVPLIVREPGRRAGRVGEVVRLIDVMPTLLDLLDVPAPATDGVSLAALMQGRRRDLDLEAYAESLYPERLGWSALRALRSGRFKLIDAPRPELFDLDRDPFEERNVHDERPDVARAMTARLHVLAADRGGSPSRAAAPGPTRELRARLAALGYLGSGLRPIPPAGALRPDPKDCIGIFAGAPPPPDAVALCQSPPLMPFERR
jgi:arylsulfatase A-like enzyme